MSYKVSRNSNRRGAVDQYVTANEWWFTEDEQPLITSLYLTADALDSNPRSNAQLTAEYLRTYKLLHDHKPVPKAVIKEEVKDIDAFDRLIENF